LVQATYQENKLLTNQSKRTSEQVFDA